MTRSVTRWVIPLGPLGAPFGDPARQPSGLGPALPPARPGADTDVAAAVVPAAGAPDQARPPRSRRRAAARRQAPQPAPAEGEVRRFADHDRLLDRRDAERARPGDLGLARRRPPLVRRAHQPPMGPAERACGTTAG